MKIRKRDVDGIQSTAAEAHKAGLQKKAEQEKISQDGGRSAEEQKVELSMSKAIAALEDNSARVERLKNLYQAGELNYSGTQIAEAVGKGIEEAIFFSRLAGEAQDE